MMSSGFRIAAIGELLWDLLPDGPQLGGAPANFAAVSAHLVASVAGGIQGTAFLVSSVGDDVLGRKAREQLPLHGLQGEEFISTDSEHPTGTVEVVIDADRSPDYRVHEQVAWDYIPETPQLNALVPTLDAVCFGTLAQRSAVSRHTIRRFVESTRRHCVRVFDVNLRAPYWTPETLAWGCANATILKMNLGEVPSVAQALAARLHGETALQLARFLLDQFPMEMIAITRGAEGSLLVTRDGIDDHPGLPVEVVDTVGAGDAFTAALTHSVLRRQPLPAVAEAANKWGAWAATQHGGIPSMIDRLVEPAASTSEI